jgi:prepilin-type N-terminal cleavage/methylation domain-containing protein
MSRQTNGERRRNGRGGFTLLELMIVTMLVGILAAIAIPRFSDLLLKAEASRLLADAHTVSLASYEVLAETGNFPSSGGPGSVPPEMAGVLGDNFFADEGVKYQWVSINFPDKNNFWQTSDLGVLIVDYSERPELADPMYSHRGTDAQWGPDQFYFFYRG